MINNIIPYIGYVLMLISKTINYMEIITFEKLNINFFFFAFKYFN